jgi:hypothetical protein
VDATVNLGNWDEKEKVRVVTLKLFDTARSFYDAKPELHKKDITWTYYKELFWSDLRTPEQSNFSSISP